MALEDDLFSGESSGGGGSGSPFGGMSLGGTAALGVGALGFGSILARGEGSLPQQYNDLTGGVPHLRSEAGALEGEGHTLVGQGTEALRMAQHGELTPEQKAQLSVFSSGLTNTARQQYAAMGRNPDQDTSFISTTANIDERINAMAQAQIQSTIQLGLGQISSGSSLIGQGLGFESAANQSLIAAGEAQIRLDNQYSTSLTSAFTAIGRMFGTVGMAAL